MLYSKATQPVLNSVAMTVLSEEVSCVLNEEASLKDLSNESCSCSLLCWEGTCEQGKLCPIIHKYLVSELSKGLRMWPACLPQLCQMCFMFVTQQPMERILVTIKYSVVGNRFVKAITWACTEYHLRPAPFFILWSVPNLYKSYD